MQHEKCLKSIRRSNGEEPDTTQRYEALMRIVQSEILEESKQENKNTKRASKSKKERAEDSETEKSEEEYFEYR